MSKPIQSIIVCIICTGSILGIIAFITILTNKCSCKKDGFVSTGARLEPTARRSPPLDFSEIRKLHKELKFQHGSLNDELVEQAVILKYLPANAKVLELGGNIGRASIIINHILKDKTQQLTVESDPVSVAHLKENRDLNTGLKFKILEGVISDRKFIQRGWQTKLAPAPLAPSEPGWQNVTNVSLGEVVKKFKLKFDTIIADCEGCLVYLFKEYPNFINQIKLIIIEHDFNNKDDLRYFTDLMNKNHLKMIFSHRKDDPEGPGNNWSDGVATDPHFVSVWERRP